MEKAVNWVHRTVDKANSASSSAYYGPGGGRGGTAHRR
jgi:hypothetical protein